MVKAINLFQIHGCNSIIINRRVARFWACVSQALTKTAVGIQPSVNVSGKRLMELLSWLLANELPHAFILGCFKNVKLWGNKDKS